MLARRICTSTTEFLKRQIALPGFGEIALTVQEIAVATAKNLKRWYVKVKPKTPILKTKKPHQLVLELNELHQLKFF